jgi:hypothetical protein
MAWIKRNLFFVIGSVIALILMGVGGYMLYTQVSHEGQVADDIAKQYTELTRLNNLKPHPGDSSGVDNVAAAAEQTDALRAYIGKIRPLFQRIQPIPDFTTNRISNAEFAAGLRITISGLRHTAESQSVLLQPDYYFTFESERKIMNFDSAGIEKLAQQLGEIKAICEILFDAKINSLDGMRRESVSANDDSSLPFYLPQKTVSTPLADISPYEVTFRCFSAELSEVLSSFANSTNALIVKSINVVPVSSGMADQPDNFNSGQPQSFQPNNLPTVRERMAFNRSPFNRMNPNAAPPTTEPAPLSRGPQTFLNEKPFRVTLLIAVVKIKPALK